MNITKHQYKQSFKLKKTDKTKITQKLSVKAKANKNAKSICGINFCFSLDKTIWQFSKERPLSMIY